MIARRSATGEINLGYDAMEFVPLKARPEEWRMFHEYRRIRHDEVRPDDPLRPDAEVEAQLKRPDPFGERIWLAIYEGDRKISGFGVGWMKPEAPGYDSNKHLIWGDASVLKEYRRRGIGTFWLRKALEIAKAHDRTVLTTGTEEEDGHAFLRFVGMGEKQKGAENRLDLKEVDWEMVERWTEEGKERSPETKVEFYEHRLPEKIWDDFTKQYSALLNTMPFDDLDHGEIVFTPEVIKEQYERLDMLKASHHTYLTREKDGMISGITDVMFLPSEPDRVGQQFTGVHPDARGRGLGKWLKAAMLIYIKDKYPEARWITTGNANSNGPMLAINKKLGFKQHKATSSYQINRDELETFLSKLEA